MAETLFEKIAKREIPSWIVWEDEKFMAFLTPFANTPGQTVLAPKQNPGGNVFEIDEDTYSELMKVARKVSNLLITAFGVSRVAMVAEGTGVAHAHIKLYPLHGKVEGKVAEEKIFFEEYQGYITTQEGPKADEETLNKWQKLILGVQKNLA